MKPASLAVAARGMGSSVHFGTGHLRVARYSHNPAVKSLDVVDGSVVSMAIASRRAETVWEGNLARGAGRVSGQSGAIGSLPVTWAARTEEPGGKTSPEELAAAAHSSCFSMALALRIADHGHDAERLTVASTVTLDEVDGAPTVVSSEIEVRARVPAMDRGDFDAAVEEAAQLCPISRLFAGAQISVDAELAP
jgi:osmotically inducible protein OsmC